MNKKQWFVLLCLFVVYLLLGAGIFYNDEYQQESIRLEKERTEKRKIEVLINDFLNSSMSHRQEDDFFESLSDYCGKPLNRKMGDLPERRKWDFYHSLFFVITVVSTIGYGNLAPTTMFGRIFMIFYGLIGIPMNGIVMVTLGNFFGKSFTKLYQRWKTSKMQYDTTRLGLISQIILYLVPGFTFFIFLPSAIMVVFEGWEYDVAVYYCFVTLTTIGFGDYVAGVDNIHVFSYFSYWTYKIFLLIWVIGGLGYVIMILNFITQAMRSKRLKAFEQIITQNIKKTPLRIRQELRTLLQEFLFLRVKRVYKGDFIYTPTAIERSQSCPDLQIYRKEDSLNLARQRAFSECPRTFILHRIQSDSDLEKIDKDMTFEPNEEFIQQQNLLLKVVDALGNLDNNEIQGYQGFTDSEILASERYNSTWSLNKNNHPILPQPYRRRAVSEVKAPTIQRKKQEFPENNLARARTFSEPNSETEKSSQNLLTRIKNKFLASRDDKNADIEKQYLEASNERRRASMFTSAEDRYLRQTNRGRASVLSVQEQEEVLEQTSIADFIRALSAITVPEAMVGSPGPRRKLGTAGLSPPRVPSPPRARRLAIRPNALNRRSSLIPEAPISGVNERRRFSLRPVEENLLAPPPYSPHPPQPTPQPSRRYSRAPLNVPSISISPVQRQVNKRDNKEEDC